MTWNLIEDMWQSYVYEVRATWPELSYHELILTREQRNLLCQQLQQCYGLSYDDADDAVTVWQQALAASFPPAAA